MIISLCVLASAVAALELRSDGGTFDLVVYGATPAGFSAAIAASKADSSLRIALVEPTNYIGGMAGPGGIGLRDFAIQELTNGTALEWALRNGAHYGKSDPVWQPDFAIGNASFWAMMLARENLVVAMNQPLDDGAHNGGVTVDGTRVTSI